MSDEEDEAKVSVKVEIVEEELDSATSEGTPMSQWSSLEDETPFINVKKVLEEEGAYEPGSGVICTKFISMSDSAITKHPYYNYPAVKDNRIKDALLEDDELFEYPPDGQELYMKLCKEMTLAPIQMFYKGLMGSKIDLSYYGVDPRQVRAMCLALQNNTSVRSLNLTDNYLSDDACYHLGELIKHNKYLEELILADCRVNVSGIHLMTPHMNENKTLKVLDLKRNRLGDHGMEILSDNLYANRHIRRLNLSHNEISAKGTISLATLFEFNNFVTHVDFSWNKMFTPAATAAMLSSLGESETLQELNLSWNSLLGPAVAAAIYKVMKVRTLEKLDLSNNRFDNEAIFYISKGVTKPKNFIELNLSCNPMTPTDALIMLQTLKMKKVKLQKLLMDDVWIDKRFLEMKDEILKLPYRSNTVVTCGGLLSDYSVVGPDPRKLILFRAEFLGNKPKKNKVDIGLYFLMLHKQNPRIITVTEMQEFLDRDGVPLDSDLVDELAIIFPGGKAAKGAALVHLPAICEYVHRLWPDTVLPPTPPPEPEPEELPTKKGAKGKKKGKK